MLMRAFFVLPLLYGTSAIAQPAVPAVEGGTAGVEIGPPWDEINVVFIERRYKVEAISFEARDESGVDFFGSDEVKVGTFDAKGFTVSAEIVDIDSGDTHEFDPAVSCIIGVQPGTVVLGESSVCGPAGEPGPFSFKVEFWEQDLSLEFCGQDSLPPGFHGGGNLHCGADDFIGRRELFFPIPDLDAGLPNVGDSFTETVTLNPCDEGNCSGPQLPDYSFTYRTTRLPDVTTSFRSELVAAMERTGIALADDAVAAGLRLQVAAPPRRAEEEPEPVESARR